MHGRRVWCAGHAAHSADPLRGCAFACAHHSARSECGLRFDDWPRCHGVRDDERGRRHFSRFFARDGACGHGSAELEPSDRAFGNRCGEYHDG
ncbi:MAG TPA: hypothetical protein VG294_17720, partial [Solirubrobacteraceae bacterium]|nr:hypothetical protein [Solirubrobacteraceae bacterium]